jgi:aldehyde dehydrogenase (NAD+)
MSLHTAHLDQRLVWVRRFRERVASNEARLAGAMAEELGKPRWEAMTADVMPVLASAKWHEKHARRALAPRKARGGGMMGLGQTHWTERRPLGHVAIIATWNYPVGLLGVQLIQAITAGNRVTVKPSEHAPRAQSMLLDLARDAGLTDEDLIVTEATREAGRTLLVDHAFDHVVFTGSTGVGRAIAEVLAPTLTTSTLELSGRDSAFVLDDADPKLAAKSIWFGVSINGGQTCVSPKRALVHEKIYPAFLRELGLYAAGAGPRRLVTAESAATASDQLRAAIDAGGRTVTGVFEPANGPWIRPQAIADCPADAALVEGRNFAPTLAVVPCRDEAAMLAIHNRCDQHLATTVFTRSPGRARSRLVPRLSAGTISFNDCVMPLGHPATAIGGVGASGWGRSQGEAGLLDLTRSVTITTTSAVVRTPLDAPPPERAEKLARMTMRLFGGKPAMPAAQSGPSASEGSPPRPSHKPMSTPAPIGAESR